MKANYFWVVWNLRMFQWSRLMNTNSPTWKYVVN